MAYAADSLIAKILGPMATIPSIKALGDDPAKWVANFRRYEPGHYAYGISQGSRYWEVANYYDRARTYYAWHVMETDADKSAEYLSKGHGLALNYRDTYAPAGDVSAHWSMPCGPAIHFALTGDQTSKNWVKNVATTMSYPYYFDNLGNLNGEMDNRMQARFLEACLLAWLLTGAQKWSDFLTEGLTRILSSQAPDGGYRFQNVNNGQNKPFMIGLLHDAMIFYARVFQNDPRIKPSIAKACDCMWGENWIAAEKTFQYSPGEGAPEGAPDLNNLIINGYQYVGQVSRAMDILNGSNACWMEGDKQFNQQYRESDCYMATFAGVTSAWEGGSQPPIDPPPDEFQPDVDGAIDDLTAAQVALADASGAVEAALNKLRPAPSRAARPGRQGPKVDDKPSKEKPHGR